MKSLKDLFGKQSQKAAKKVEEPAAHGEKQGEDEEDTQPAKKKRKT